MFKKEKNEREEKKISYSTLAICLVTVLLAVIVACFIF